MTSYQYEPEEKKPAIYCIDGKINFNPANNTLSDIGESKKITLYTPATRCFLHLIEHQGKISSQQELMHAGWEKHGMAVSPNTFFQNISHLRKMLFEIIGDNEIITTIKRSGLVINSAITIKKIEQQILPVENTLLPQVISEKKSLKNSLVSYLTSEPVGLIDKIALLFLTIIMLFVLFITIFFANHNYTTETEYATKYEHVADAANGCEIYVNRDSGSKLFENTTITPQNFDCKGFSKVYVTQWAKHFRFSIFFCNSKNNMYCISEYYGVEKQ